MNEVTPTAEIPQVKPGARGRWLSFALGALEPLSIAGLFIYLLNMSWLRWADPLIDFPKDLYIAWRVSEGDLLYQNITNWYGPLSHLVEAAGFRLFGVGMDTVIWMNIVLTGVTLLLLRSIFGLLGNRLSVWLGSVVFLIVFAVGHLTEIANYNFIAPYVSQATYSFFGLLLVLWGLLRHLQSGKSAWLGVSGLGLAVAYLDKPEAVLAAVGAIGVYFFAQTIYQVRYAKRFWIVKSLAWLVGGFLCLVLPVFGYFWREGGAAYAFRAVNYVVVTVMDKSILAQVQSNQLMQYFSGMDHPQENFLTQAVAGAQLLIICGAIVLGARRWARAPRYSASWWFLLVATVGTAVLGAWMGQINDNWMNTGPAFAFPVILVTLLVVVWSLRAGWLRREDFPRALGLAVVGVAASLMLTRMILNARLSQYGFFMMPLAVWFWIQVVMVEAARIGKNIAETRRNWLLPVTFAAVVLFATAAVLRFEVGFYARKTLAVGEGRDRSYTFPLQVFKSGSKFTQGLMLNTMISAFKAKSPHARTLVAFPEGVAVNYHLRVRSPLAESEFHPLALGYIGPGHVVEELQANPPDAVIFFYRDMGEFGVRYFGENEASGRAIVRWVQENYVPAGKAGLSQRTLTGHAVDIYVRKPLGRDPPMNFGPF